MPANRIIKFSSVAALATLSVMSASWADPEKVGDLETGRKIYMSNCEVCHLIGRNLLKPEKEIQNSKIMDNSQEVKEFLSHKNGTMPPFVEISKNDAEIKHLCEFLQYAKHNPSKVNKHTDSKDNTKSVAKPKKK